VPSPREEPESRSSVDLITRASAGVAPKIERMPRPTIRRMVDMRDGARLDTWVWLPADQPGPFPAILIRTPYQEHVLGWARLGTRRYTDAGYAVVFQLIRGIGASEGRYTFFNPANRTDGYDTVEWIAAQPWCDGAVGMDGSSYAGITQIMAATTQPPHLRCIIPAVVSAHPFLHVPRYGGAFARQHTLGWTQIISVDSLTELTPGLWGAAALLSSPDSWKRLLSRPALDAAEGVLDGDRLQHYRDVLLHTNMDEYNTALTLDAADYARVTVPALLVTGLFDSTMGTQYAWRMLEEHAPVEAERRLLIGPWDHGQAYVGGGRRFGPFDFGDAADFDLPGARLAFFDRHLKGVGEGPPLPGRVSVFVAGANRWLAAERYPVPAVDAQAAYLHSDGLANLRGRGTLDFAVPEGDEPADSFQSDPDLPFVPVAANLDPKLVLDLRETERLEDVLTYTSAPLEAPLTLVGEFAVELHLTADAPDGDIVCWLAEVPPDGKRTTMISHGLLRLRYRQGFDAERLLTPGEPVRVQVPMHHAAHRLEPGSRLRLLIGGGLFPLIDPNPNTGEPIATAVETRVAVQTIFHDAARPSLIRLPVLRDSERRR
jgi:uncharacterized protein